MTRRPLRITLVSSWSRSHMPQLLMGGRQAGKRNLAQRRAMRDGEFMTDWTDSTAAARTWFETLRDRICSAFEAIEHEAGSDAAFEYTAWDRAEAGNADPGGGVRGVMKGRVFEKVGVNVSTVRGDFAPEFAGTIHGAGAE